MRCQYPTVSWEAPPALWPGVLRQACRARRRQMGGLRPGMAGTAGGGLRQSVTAGAGLRQVEPGAITGRTSPGEADGVQVHDSSLSIRVVAGHGDGSAPGGAGASCGGNRAKGCSAPRIWLAGAGCFLDYLGVCSDEPGLASAVPRLWSRQRQRLERASGAVGSQVFFSRGRVGRQLPDLVGGKTGAGRRHRLAAWMRA